VTIQSRRTMIEERPARYSCAAGTQTRNDYEEWLDELQPRLDSKKFQEYMEEDHAQYPDDDAYMIELMMEYSGASGQPSHNNLSDEVD
jgi:hypothetical protein